MFSNFFTKKKIPFQLEYPDLSLVKPLTRAFSHKDSEQDIPLLKALKNGFTYIEADIHLINKQLYVSHNRPLFLNRENQLTPLYLNPLLELFNLNGGRIFPEYNQTIYLVIDFKTNANLTLAALQDVLEPYRDMLTRWKNGIEIPNAITIMITGNRPIEQLVKQKERWVCLDGRLEDIGKNFSPEIMPMISDKYSKIFGWSILSKTPSKEKLFQLNKVSNNTHAEGKKLRLWKSPENELVWDSILGAGVDVINTDSLERLSSYFYDRYDFISLANK